MQIGLAANIPNLWAYFVLDQILPVSFTQNLFCAALTRIGNFPLKTHGTEPDQIFISCLRLAGLLCYILTLYWIPLTVNTGQFFLTLFALRILLLIPYVIDCLAYRLWQTSYRNPGFTTESFNKCLVAVLSIVVAHAGVQSGLTFKVYEESGAASPKTNYAAAALSNDMVLGFLGGIAFFFLLWRQ